MFKLMAEPYHKLMREVQSMIISLSISGMKNRSVQQIDSKTHTQPNALRHTALYTSKDQFSVIEKQCMVGLL